MSYMQTPERETVPKPAENEVEKPESTKEDLSQIELLEKIKKSSAPSAQTDDTQTQAQASDDQKTQTVTIMVPASTTQLDDWAKGDPQESLTWIAVYWLRLIKKGLHFGWRILTRGSQQAATLPIFL